VVLDELVDVAWRLTPSKATMKSSVKMAATCAARAPRRGRRGQPAGQLALVGHQPLDRRGGQRGKVGSSASRRATTSPRGATGSRS
jgi:hypothetical protein